MQKILLFALCALFCCVVALPDEVAHCKIVGTSLDANITGTIKFTAVDVNNTRVTVDISGITQRTNASHGMHIHAAGDLVSSVNGASADGHFFGVGGAVHGCPVLNASRHSGDMGKWNVSVDGKIQYEKVLDKLPLSGPNSIIGHAAVLHFDDDYCIGATGNAGTRLAWCVVGVANITGVGKTNTAGVDTTAGTVYNATCKLQPTSVGVNVSGSFWFIQSGNNMEVYGKVQNLAFNSTHGVHIHAFGDLFSANGLQTAGHYNPIAGGTHKLPPSAGRHVGDLGNIQYYDTAGYAWYHETLTGINIVGTNSIIGRGLIVHQIADNGCTQPTGNSMARLAQCVIGFGGSQFKVPPAIPNTVTIVPQTGSKCINGAPVSETEFECFEKATACNVPYQSCILGETFTKGVTCTKCWGELIACLNAQLDLDCYDAAQKAKCFADCPNGIDTTCAGNDGIKISAAYLLTVLLLLVSLMFQF